MAGNGVGEGDIGRGTEGVPALAGLFIGGKGAAVGGGGGGTAVRVGGGGGTGLADRAFGGGGGGVNGISSAIESSFMLQQNRVLARPMQPVID